MNVHLAPALLVESIQPYRLGMPQLGLGGLSEGWLLKELGDRHWMLLAKLAGRALPDFRDLDGAPVYAAFCALAIEGARFDALGENDTLVLRSTLWRLSRSQFASRHELRRGDAPMGTVELISVFVRRLAGGGNHRVARVDLTGFPPPLEALPDSPAASVSGLAARAAALRAGRERLAVGEAMEAAAAEGEAIADQTTADDEVISGACAFSGALEVDPCPSQDFNGAGFLYFSSFVGLVDRAEWTFHGRRAPRATTRRREVFFHGNADPGERLRLHWRIAEPQGEGDAMGGERLVHHCRLERMSDGARLADVFTERAL